MRRLLLLAVIFAGCEATTTDKASPPSSTVSQALSNNCFTDPSNCYHPTLNKITCYTPGSATTASAGYSYSDSAGTDGANGFSGTNYGDFVVQLLPNVQAPAFASLSASQQRDIQRFMNNLAMSAIGGVPSTQSLLNHFAIGPSLGGYSKWFSVDTAYRHDYLVYWNAANNCAYMMTNLPGWQGAIANIFVKYGSLTGSDGIAYEHGPLGLPTSNFYGDAWGVSWQRFTHGYITSYSTGYGDMTNRAYYVGGSGIEDTALAARYGMFFDYAGAGGGDAFPLTQDPTCTNSVFGYCGNPAGRFTKAIGPYNYVQTIVARNGSHVAFNVGGEIANKWRASYGSTQPWNGALGFPRSDEFNNQGVTQQNFDNGNMTWTGTATIATPAACSSTCPDSQATTTCWDSTRGIQLTCGGAICSSACNYGSAPTDYCVNEGFNSTCGSARLDSSNGDCLHDPAHAGCAPLAMSNNRTYGICNDGSSVPLVTGVSTRSWTQLSGPSTTSGTEQYNINTLMNNAAALVGCNYDVNHWSTSDTSTNASDASTYAYYKVYGKRDAAGNTDQTCAAVYFNRTLGCAFPLSLSKYPPGVASVAATPQIQQEWTTFGLANLGLPTSLPHRSSESSVMWQRFQAGYITSETGYLYAGVAGGDNVLGTHGEGRILAQRFGNDFDYYNPYALTPSMLPPLTSVTICNNSTIDHDWQCAGADGLVVSTADLSPQATYWEALGSSKAVATKGAIDSKFSSLTIYGGNYPNSPTNSPMRWPVGEPKQDGTATYQQFVGGRIYAQNGQPSYVVSNVMSRAYERLGGVTSLGYPLEDTPSYATPSLPTKQRFSLGDINIGLNGLWTVDPDPNAPNTLEVGYTQTSHDGLPVLMGWYNTAGTQQVIVYRQVNGDGTYTGSGWSPVYTDNAPTFTWMENWQDPNATPGAKNCYYLQISPGGALSNIACTRARDHSDRYFPITRAELRVRVANVANAGTDDGVTVRLSDSSSTHIDSPIDDFQQNSNVTYALNVQNLQSFADIQQLTISVGGDDHLCISEIELDINRQPAGFSGTNNYVAFQKTYGDANCVWVYDSSDTVNGRSLSIGYDELRAYPGWNTVTPSGPGTTQQWYGYDKAGFIEFLNGIIGDQLDGYANFENGNPTTLAREHTSYNSSLLSDTDISVSIHISQALFNAQVNFTIALEPKWQCPNVNQGMNVAIGGASVTATINLPVIGYLMDAWFTPLSAYYLDVGGSMVNSLAGPYTISGNDIGFSNLNLPATEHFAFPLTAPAAQVDGISLVFPDTNDNYPYNAACP